MDFSIFFFSCFTPKKARLFFICLFMVFLFPLNAAAERKILHSTAPALYHKNKTGFQGAEGTGLTLYGAGNETVSFQIAVLDPAENLSVRIVDSAGSKKINSLNFDFYMLDDCQGNGEPDCLIPIGENGFKPTAYHRDSGCATIWGDLHIPFRQAPGSYHARLLIFSANNIRLAEIPVRLKVFSFSLPRKPSLKSDLNNYGVRFVRRWNAEIGSERGNRIERAFYRMAGKHRMTFNPLPYKSQRGNPHPTMAPLLEGKGEGLRVKDWTDFDSRYGPLFEGSAFEDGIPIDHQYLPFNPEWPSDFSNYFENRELYEKEWKQVAAAFTRHFREKGWDRTVFHIFMNQNPSSNNKIPWYLDEPKGEESYKALRYYADLTHKVFPPKAAPNFKFRIDISHFYCDKHRGNIRKDFRLNSGWDILKPVDIWVISKHSMDVLPARIRALKLKNMGKTVYEYFSGHRMPLLDEPLLKAVQYGWNAWLRNEDGILFWNTVKGSSMSDGRDFLLYPGAIRDIDGPIASVRLKAVRRGIQDYEYFKQASKVRDVKALIEKYKTNDPLDYLVCRKKLGELIEADAVHTDY